MLLKTIKFAIDKHNGKYTSAMSPLAIANEESVADVTNKLYLEDLINEES
jgi:hypothetical protein